MAWSWSDIGQSIADVAPTIAGVLANVVLPGTGPAVSVVASAGIRYLLEALGIAGDPNDPETIEAAQSALAAAHPETLLRLKEADNKFKTDMATIGVQLEDIAFRDRDSARAREIQVRDQTPRNLAYLTVVAVAIINLALLSASASGVFATLDSFSSSMIAASATAINGLAGMVYTYYYGSSRGSRTKDDTISDLSAKQAQQG